MKKPWTPWVELITDGSPLPHIWRLHLVDWPFRFYLHHILRPDHDRYLHNHPRPFISVVIRGAYAEQTCQTRLSEGIVRVVGRGGSRFNVMSTTRFHKISAVDDNTWTLLLGRYRKEASDWGFLTPQRDVIPQTEWVNHPFRAEAG